MRFPYSRFGPAVNPVGEFVEMNGRLGEVTTCTYRETPAGWVCTVKHFDGSPWPVQPVLSALHWIKQD